MTVRDTATARDAEHWAILIRVDELLANPSAAWLIDHYLDRLLSPGRDD